MLQLIEGCAHQQGCDQQDRAGGQSPRTVTVVVPVAAAPVGPVAVITKTALHLGPGVASVGFVAEPFVGAGFHDSVGSCDGGAGIGVLGAGGGALSVAVVLIGRHTCVTFEGVAVADE